MEKRMKAFLITLTIIFLLAALGLFLWLGIGQYVAQMNYDGQYIEWRTIKDVSQWGWMGFLPAILALVTGFFASVVD
jgi:hypothetical protein